MNYAKHIICSRGVTIHIPCDLIQFQLLVAFNFAYFNLIMQNTNVFFFLILTTRHTMQTEGQHFYKATQNGTQMNALQTSKGSGF